MAQRRKGAEPKPSLRLLAGELDLLREVWRRRSRKIEIDASERPKVVVLLPGFLAAPVQMSYLARQIEAAGHTAKKWGMGFNLGASKQRIATLERRLDAINQRYGQPVVLLGWSLGGIFAREMAHRHPEQVEKVITMGSPIAGDRRSNNAWRAYQLVTGHAVDDLPVAVEMERKPPVDTVAMWSARDGIIPPQCAQGSDALADRRVEVDCTHIGFSYDPKAVRAVLRELDGS